MAATRACGWPPHSFRCPSYNCPVRPTYFDYAASAPLRPAAREAFLTASDVVGNPASLHTYGRAAHAVLEQAREELASHFGVRPTAVVLCSGGTEADNLGVRGSYAARHGKDSRKDLVLASGIEHPAVRASVESLRSQGANVELIPTNRDGTVDLDWLSQVVVAHGESLALCAVMWANNETGVIQPISQILELLAPIDVPLHVDGVQAAAWLELPRAWLAHRFTLAVSGHKVGAPVGVGALVVNGVDVLPTTHGGSQELNRRPGTGAAALVAAMAAAVGQTSSDEAQMVARLTAQLREGLADVAPDCQINGELAPQLPGITSVTLPGCSAESLLLLLDQAGFSCSAGSACSAGVTRPSSVLMAMGVSEVHAAQTLRISLGWGSTADEVSRFVAVLAEVVRRSRQVRVGA